jgi:hypothetical protein
MDALQEGDVVLLQELLKLYPPSLAHRAKEAAWQEVADRVSERLDVPMKVGTAKTKLTRLRHLHRQGGAEGNGKGRHTRAAVRDAQVRDLLHALFSRYPSEDKGATAEGEGEGEAKSKAKGKGRAKSIDAPAVLDHHPGR